MIDIQKIFEELNQCDNFKKIKLENSPINVFWDVEKKCYLVLRSCLAIHRYLLNPPSASRYHSGRKRRKYIGQVSICKRVTRG